MRAKAGLTLGDAWVQLHREPQGTRFLMLVFGKLWRNAKAWGVGFRVGDQLSYWGVCYLFFIGGVTMLG